MAAIPPSARVRGIYMRMLENELEQRKRLGAYREFFLDDPRWTMGYYPLGQYLARLACAGALLTSPERLHDGMREINYSFATRFAKSLIGRALIRLLANDPVRLGEQALASRRQTCSYGRWQFYRRGERKIEMIYRNEYMWIESAVAGGAQGAFAACGLDSTLETRLIDRFNGSTIVQW